MAKEEGAPHNVVAIIQARLGSGRFPGKVLVDPRVHPVVEWVVDAVRRVGGVNQIVVATTTNVEDQAIDGWCEENGINCFRGESLYVLKRYADCATEYRASHVLRITADCPLLDSETVSAVLSGGREAIAEYFSLSGNFPEGFDCEGFVVNALIRADKDARRASKREHVTPFLKNLENGFILHYTRFRTGAALLRLTVDQPEDLDFFRVLLEQLSLMKDPVPLEIILAALADAPALGQINGHIFRNEGYLLSLEKDGLLHNSG